MVNRPVQIRLTDSDKAKIALIKDRWGLKTTTDAIRWALIVASEMQRLPVSRPVDLVRLANPREPLATEGMVITVSPKTS